MFLTHTILKPTLSQLYNYSIAIKKIKITITALGVFPLTNKLNSLSN